MKRPNFLLALADDASHMSAYGHRFLQTPHFDRVAKEGVLFENAYTCNPKCAPSRACILTGMHTWQLEDACVHYSQFSAKFAVFPQLLENVGYKSGFTGKGWGPGNWEIGGFAHNPAGWEYNQHKLTPPEGSRIRDIDYTRNFKQFMEERRDDSPFCFWYGGFEPHRPYNKGEGVRAGIDPDQIVPPSYLPNEEIVRNDLADYASEIQWFDRHLGNMLKILEQMGELGNTVVLVLSDNGMPFPRVKGQMYEQDFHLPLAIMWNQQIPGGRKVADLTSFSDLAPTILALAGVENHPQMAGKSFAKMLLSNEENQTSYANPYVYMGKERHDVGRENNVGYPARCIRGGNYLYVHNYAPHRWPAGDPRTKFTNVDPSPTKKLIIDKKLMGEDYYYDLSFGKRPAEELFDVVNDPECLNNLADSPAYCDIKKELRQTLEDELIRSLDPRLGDDPDVFDRCVYYGDGAHRWENYVRGDFTYRDE